MATTTTSSGSPELQPQPYRIGDRIRVRRNRWLVTAIHDDAGCRFLTLRGVGNGNLDEQRTFLAPFERIEPTVPRGDSAGSESSHAVSRNRWRTACRRVLTNCGPWTALHSLNTASIDLWPHQLEPALAVLSGAGCRVLLADAVGLGKTVQACLLLAELQRRGAVESALILTPVGLRDQWGHELARFHVPADIIDYRAAFQRSAELPVGVSAWTIPRVAIASMDYVKRAEVFPSVHARVWDLVVVDEAHLVGPDTDRYAAVSRLCADALYVVLVTATPHSGDREAYAALRAIGEQGDPCLAFRRSRADVHLATERHVHHLRVRPSRTETQLHTALERYASAIHRERGDDAGTALLIAVLWKRTLSSPESLRLSVHRRLQTLAGTTSFDTEQLILPLDDGRGELDASDEAPSLEALALQDADRERALLERLSRAAVAACTTDTKLRALARLLRRLGRQREPVIVFTEYRDTLLHVRRTLAPHAVVLHGGLTRSERQSVIHQFTSGGCLVLLATDAAGEGLNLHHACRCVVHLELPWNPVRLEQRTGRVDRIGQQRTVHAFHLVSTHRSEELLLARLQARVSTAQDEVGMLDPLENQRRGPEPRFAPPSAAVTNEMTRLSLVRGLTTRGKTGRRHLEEPVDGRERLCIRPRSALRYRLRGHTLLIVEIVAENEEGQIVSGTVTPMILSSNLAPAERDSERAVIIDAVIESFAHRDPWIGQFTAFWAAAGTRAAAVAEGTTPASIALFQPGLFDRRADRLRAALLDERHLRAEAIIRRQNRIALAGRRPRVRTRHWLWVTS